jgi:hypothetical protein
VVEECPSREDQPSYPLPCNASDCETLEVGTNPKNKITTRTKKPFMTRTFLVLFCLGDLTSSIRPLLHREDCFAKWF